MKTLLKECSDVLTLNITTLAISFTDIEMLLKIVLLLLSIIYTADKLIKNQKKKQDEKLDLQNYLLFDFEKSVYWYL